MLPPGLFFKIVPSQRLTANPEPLQTGAHAIFTKLGEFEATVTILLREVAAIDPPSTEIDAWRPVLPPSTGPIPT
jgi:hypothetical protein